MSVGEEVDSLLQDLRACPEAAACFAAGGIEGS